MSVRPLPRILSQSIRSSLRQNKLNPRPAPIYTLQCRQYTVHRSQRHTRTPLLYFSLPGPRQFHAFAKSQVGLMPDTSDPQPKESEPHDEVTQPTDITYEEFHKLADAYLDELQQKVEKMQEEMEGVDVEYSAGVMTIEIANKGSYVLNKQPPNKQIWLSSPVSGPKRFDWVLVGESMNEKEGTGGGEWIYLRDGSRLSQILRKEIGIDSGSGDEAWESQQNQAVTE